jgi:metal-sulfur cluster biosynthetic enzyme
MVTKKEILAKLSEVIDPEIGINIVDMGLIYGVETKGDKVYVKMTFTTPACPLINELMHQANEKLREIKGTDIELKIVFDPPWNPGMMSEKAKIKLGIS